MTKVLDLASNPDEPLNGENVLATDGTGTITVQIAKLKLLTPRARGLAMAALGITTPEQADLAKNLMRARTEVSRPGGALRAKTRLELAVVSQASFWSFVRSGPSADVYQHALEADGVKVGADGSLGGADGKVVEIGVTFGDDGNSFTIESAKVRR